MKRMESTVNALPAPTAGTMLAHDLRRVLAASVGLGAGVLLVVLVVAIAVREWSWDWCVWPLIAAALPPLLWAVGNLVELVRSMMERILRIDLDGDGYVGAPAKVYLNPYLGQATAARETADLDMAHEAEFIRGCAAGTSMGRWEKLIGRKTYEAYRDDLLRLGWAVWNEPGNVKAGWKLTTTPEETIRGMWG